MAYSDGPMQGDSTEPSVEIRAVAEGDVGAVVALVRDVLAEFDLDFGAGSSTDDALRDLPASYEEHGGAFWVAEHDGAIVGSCGVYPVAHGTYELRKMYLHPNARGLGMGTQLLARATAWVRGRGGQRIVLDTTEQMSRAIAFYESHGFVRDDQEIRGARCTRGYALDL
jgi:GNAT superfamily N-acetyltransferase